MKMLIDIYCRFPKTVEPIKRTTLQKIQLKCKSTSFNISRQEKHDEHAAKQADNLG